MRRSVGERLAIARLSATIVAMEAASTWNSLEVVKLAVAFATPVAVGVLGWMVQRRLKRLDRAQWHSQKLIERRLDLFDRTGDRLHALASHFSGARDLRVSPEDAAAHKRELDKAFEVNRRLLSARFRTLYFEYIDKCFETRAGERATLRAIESVRAVDIWDAYTRLMDTFSVEIGVAQESEDGRAKELESRRLTIACQRVLTRMRSLEVAADEQVRNDEKWLLGEELDDLGEAIVETNGAEEWRALHERIRMDVVLGADLTQLDQRIDELEQLLSQARSP